MCVDVFKVRVQDIAETSLEGKKSAFYRVFICKNIFPLSYVGTSEKSLRYTAINVFLQICVGEYYTMCLNW